MPLELEYQSAVAQAAGVSMYEQYSML